MTGSQKETKTSPAPSPGASLSAKTQIPRQNKRICRRKRLHNQVFKLLEKSNIWVAGPPGSGKTVLISDIAVISSNPVAWYEIDPLDNDPVNFFSYFSQSLSSSFSQDSFDPPLPKLLPENMLALPIFARKFFRHLFKQLQQQWLLVFDNFQEFPKNSPILELIEVCIQELPIDCRIVIISRQPPPPVFAKIKTDGALKVLSEDNLRFNREEISKIAALHGISSKDVNCIDYLQQTTAGWAAGLTLLLTEQNRTVCSQNTGQELDHQELFDYFTGVIFAKLPDREKQTLMRAALLPDIQPDILDQLCGDFSSRKYFTELSKNNFFTYSLDRHDTLFQFHPLFKEFLCNKAQTLPSIELKTFHEKAAKILMNEGRTCDAIELLIHAGNWQRSTELIQENGTAMLQQGRFKILLYWQHNLPHHAVDNNPWLLFFFGNATTAFDPPKAINLLKKSFNLFQKQQNTNGALLACSSLTNSIINHLFDLSALDPWLDFLEQQLDPKAFANDDSFEKISLSNAIFRAIVLRRPAHPDLKFWLELVIAQDCLQPALITHYLWTGQFPEARAALDRMYIHQNHIGSKLLLSALKAMETQYFLIMDEPENCCRVIDESLEAINETGIRVWEIHFLVLGAGCCINSGRQKQAEKYLQAVEKNINKARLLERSYYHVVKTLQALLNDDLVAADHHQQSALQMAITVGMPSYETWCWCGSALVALYQGNYKDAVIRFDKVFELSTLPGNPWFTCQTYLGLAYMYYKKGDKQATIQHLHMGFQLARRCNYLSFFFLLPEIMQILSVIALENNIEPDFVCRFIKKKNLKPAHPPVHLTNWPWPLKIYTLGRFSIIRDGETLQPSQSKNKPVMLLQALIALGGRQVGKTQLCDIFWPDSEGDFQAAALKTTLHRMRQLLGIQNAIIQTPVYLSLNPSICWVDSWQFERLANKAIQTGKKDNKKTVAENRRILAVYKGDFLAPHQDEPWLMEYRQRLQKIRNQLMKRVVH